MKPRIIPTAEAEKIVEDLLSKEESRLNDIEKLNLSEVNLYLITTEKMKENQKQIVEIMKNRLDTFDNLHSSRGQSFYQEMLKFKAIHRLEKFQNFIIELTQQKEALEDLKNLQQRLQLQIIQNQLESSSMKSVDKKEGKASELLSLNASSDVPIISDTDNNILIKKALGALDKHAHLMEKFKKSDKKRLSVEKQLSEHKKLLADTQKLLEVEKKQTEHFKNEIAEIHAQQEGKKAYAKIRGVDLATIMTQLDPKQFFHRADTDPTLHKLRVLNKKNKFTISYQEIKDCLSNENIRDIFHHPQDHLFPLSRSGKIVREIAHCFLSSHLQLEQVIEKVKAT